MTYPIVVETFHENHKWQPYGRIREVFILHVETMTICTNRFFSFFFFLSIYLIVEIFPSGPKWWTERPASQYCLG